MIKIFICDDDRSSLMQAEQLIHAWAEGSGQPVTVFTFDNGDSLLARHKKEQADIILLDIMMPLLNGMEAAREIRKMDSSVKIIFLTSSPEFAVESYDVKASGYLLKPIHHNKLHAVLSDCVKVPEKEPDHIVIKTLSGYQKIYLHSIECIEAQSRKVIFYLMEGSTAEALGTFSSYAQTLPLEKGFYKCHRSYMVNLPNIDHFNSTEIITRSRIRVPVARGLGKAFKEAYFAYMFRKEREEND